MAKAAVTRSIRDDHQKNFLKIFNSLTGKHSRWEIWEDFVTLTAIEISNSTDKVNAPERTKMYQTIVSKYSAKEREGMAEMLGEVIMGMEQNPDQDFLGSLYMMCELGNDHAEQELNKGNWEQFVHERCLEITCGEAPFLTSRYDPTTGEPVAIPDRVGILDRKLRVIQENATHKFQWKALVSSAYQSVYGYEYQGDNLLLARVNLFLTFTENWIEKLGFPISASWAIAVATRISWNIWQMDGLKDTVPGTDILCLIYDWEKNEEVTFRKIKEESDNV